MVRAIDVLASCNATADEFRDKRIFSTGCAGILRANNHQALLIPVDENANLTDCYYEKKDWRACKAEVS